MIMVRTPTCQIVSCVEEVIFSSTSVCLLVSSITQKLLIQFTQNSVEKCHMALKKPVHVGGTPDHVTSALGDG